MAALATNRSPKATKHRAHHEIGSSKCCARLQKVPPDCQRFILTLHLQVQHVIKMRASLDLKPGLYCIHRKNAFSDLVGFT